MTTATQDEVNINQIDEQIEQELKTTLTLAIQTDSLKAAIGKVEKAISKRTTIEIFTYIYIDIQPDLLTFRGVNGDYIEEATIKQNEDQSNFKITAGNGGSVCFPGAKFVDIVKKLQHKDTAIKIEEYKAVIKSGRPKFSINGVSGDEFPAMPDIDPATSVSISLHSDILSTMYNKTMYAASASETRPILTGVEHKILDNNFKCVATDSHRLAQYVHEMDEENLPDFNAVVPASVLKEVKKHLDAYSGEVLLHLSDSQLIYEFFDVRLSTRLLDGNYPATERLIFKEANIGVTFIAGPLKEMLTRATVMNEDKPIRIKIKPELNQCRISTLENQIGAFQEDITTLKGEGPDIELCVNVRYLQDALSKYGADDYVRFEFLEALRPFKLRLLDGNPDCLEIVLPVRSFDNNNTTDEVVIENFQDAMAVQEFNPFEDDFNNIE